MEVSEALFNKLYETSGSLPVDSCTYSPTDAVEIKTYISGMFNSNVSFLLDLRNFSILHLSKGAKISKITNQLLDASDKLQSKLSEIKKAFLSGLQDGDGGSSKQIENSYTNFI